MARSIRATTLLLIALGAAAPALPASAAAANAGGAAPGSEAVGPVPTSEGSVGGAAPGVTPAQRATSSGVGGALSGRKPPRPKVVRRKPAARKPATRAPATPKPVAPITTVSGVFPVQGAFNFGGEDARFGAGRPGHIHQGQDVVAASGEPIVAPVAGTVTWKANQPGGAGIYLVVRGAGSGEVRDYVFMHIKRGTVLVAPGDAVSAGQQLAQVGATGAASGPHLHFEIWIGGWFARGGAPVDPLPQLQRWAGL
ncbi:MAG TPA: peptidoglycan DD-metalloendopeptidase family protein [Conexibacter sp.]|jgi:murein DD-endopeptidase MepM/ murein hydrolase activator NlpD|nr:peptidoglycan DD-metalloendopeptidase family protein [Conexibacter sp.]